MKYRCELPAALVDRAKYFDEFANGGAQATVTLKDGRSIHGVLISNSSAIIAARGYDTPPFDVSEIDDIFQADEDRKPVDRGGWKFWDKWQ